MREINHRFCIAPMMQCTDIHDRYLFRLITKKSILYTEMVTTGAIIHGECIEQLRFNDLVEHPVAVQLGGSDPKDLAACAKICDAMGYDEINLNVGCPSERVQKGAFGACLMKEPTLVSECIEAMQEVTTLPVTVKCRIGVDDNDDYEFLHNFTESIMNPLMQTLIVHARVAILKGLSPRQNRSVPPLKYDHVYQLKKDFPNLEIVINGGIQNINESIQHLNEVDGVMLGRSAYDNPMITSQVDELIFNASPQICDRKKILNSYLLYCLEQNDLGHSYSRTLKHVFGINKGMPHARKYRKLILDTMQQNNLQNNLEDLVSLV
ncbi:tRNA dihydrouridine(20/20a) synthase DusA [Gammaproteobacteria bacterium]|jgi:tRNA-dihydrouridine synthase A|nr:tRNA dihydrouridine(20/20a) synthase DusA [Gammaproteobacteria bacterium]MDA9142635.1 tRNA dihydrouridine(20/20a) synthase DusA [Gammaproteobacteria bacterium]MDA9204102.1 tRNA dihydrouridine(20/20a) synthase DusA [Gammaproteobacteria bacterium]MDA9259864.1 tRNA dihydrouridine(20/20a) synthase DusA [Gammaproteobacteria bacterium]MDA9269166.1 tRNA dihydrouridine(20/20a) synthase DusA [Gammaproteobacteria bacterium]